MKFIHSARLSRKLAGLLAATVTAAASLVIAQVLSSPAPAVAASAVNWGLSFQTQGAPPIGNASADALHAHRAFYVGDTAQPIIYLTFDAGYESGDTPQILEALRKHNAPACFFLVSNYMETAPELVQRMVAEGHTIGNHTASHPDMSKISDKDAFEKELRGMEEQYKTLIGEDMPKFYRPPQGKYSEENLRHAKELGYATVFWSLAYVDWYADNQPTHQQAFDKLLPRIHNGAIVLLHSTSRTNAEILDKLLTEYEQMGYTFGSIPDLAASLYAQDTDTPS